MVEYLDKIGLAYLWGKLKALLNSKVDKVSSTDNAIVRFNGTTGDVQNSNATINDNGYITASKFVKSGGTASQFLKADGSVDATEYATKASDNGKVPYNDALMPTNTFGGKRLYINSLDNAFYAADKKFYVTVTTHKKSIEGVSYPYVNTTKEVTDDDYFVDSPVVKTMSTTAIFDGSYETNILCESDEYMKVRIMFGSNTSPSATTSYFPGYPYGSYYLSYYYKLVPKISSQCRIYNKYAPNVIGWHLHTFKAFVGTYNQQNLIETVLIDDYYYRSCVEFIIFGGENNNGSTSGTELTQIDCKLSRPDLRLHGSTVTKYGKQTIYYPFEWYNNHTKTLEINSNGDITALRLIKSGGTSSQFLKADGSVDSTSYLPANGNAASATKATQDGSGNNIESTYQKKAELEPILDEIKSDIKSTEGIHVLTMGTSHAAVTTSPYYAARWVGTHAAITELYTGLVVEVKVPVAGNSSYGTVLNVNGLGEHPVCANVNSMIGTRYAVGCFITLIYDADQTATVYLNSASSTSVTGVWKIADYDTVNNFQLRHNAGTYKAAAILYCYKLLLQSKDGLSLIPVNTTDSNGTSKVMTTAKFNPHGQILYCSASTTIQANADIASTYLYNQINIDIRRSFNVSSLTANKDVFIVAVPQADGMAVLDSGTAITQDLPQAEDGKIYIYLGHASATTTVELHVTHPIYYYKDGAIRLWTADSYAYIDSSINDLILSDIGLANAIKTLVNESDGKYDSLSDTIDNLIENSLPVSLSISPNTIFVGDSSTLAFSAKSKDSASSIIIKDGNGTQIASGSGTSLVGSTTVTPSTEGVLWYYVTAVVNGTTLSAKSYVNCVRPIYYGSGTNYTSATTVSDAKQAPNGKYTISVNSANNYIYFVVPSSMTISKVLMNGLSMPMQATSVQKDGQSYTAYQSVNGYDVGTYNLDVE